jgi:hypothetical protein
VKAVRVLIDGRLAACRGGGPWLDPLKLRVIWLYNFQPCEEFDSVRSWGLSRRAT